MTNDNENNLKKIGNNGDDEVQQMQ